jgi:hypothetical protein
MVKKYMTILLVAVLTIVHGMIVLGSTFSLPVILMFPDTRLYYLAGIAVVLVSWALFSNCPLTVAEQKLRARIHWPQLIKEDFISHYLASLLRVQVPLRAKSIVERVYLVTVLVIILLRWRLA